MAAGMNRDCNRSQICRSTVPLGGGLSEELISHRQAPSLLHRRLMVEAGFICSDATGCWQGQDCCRGHLEDRGCEDVACCYRPFDVIAFVEVPDLTTLSDLVLENIQKVEGVEKTQTAVVVTPDVFGSSPLKTHVNKGPSR